MAGDVLRRQLRQAAGHQAQVGSRGSFQVLEVRWLGGERRVSFILILVLFNNKDMLT